MPSEAIKIDFAASQDYPELVAQFSNLLDRFYPEGDEPNCLLLQQQSDREVTRDQMEQLLDAPRSYIVATQSPRGERVLTRVREFPESLIRARSS